MRGLTAAAGLGLAIGLVAACYNDDFLLGALCGRDTDCGDDQCCAGRRCRPQPDDCYLLEADNDQPFVAAYMPCDDDAACLEHGMPRCVIWQGAARGFCADLCVGAPSLYCNRHVFLAPLDTLPRTCVDVDGQSLCALDCSQNNNCPDEMQCHAGVCVPTP